MTGGPDTGELTGGYERREPAGGTDAPESTRTNGNRESTTLDRRGVLRGMATGTAAGVAGLAATGGVGAKPDLGEDREYDSPSAENWEDVFDAISGGCLVLDWPEPTADRIDLSGGEPTEQGDVPEGGDLIVYVHGFGVEDIGTAFTGAHQARGFELALQAESVDVPVVAGMWSSLVPPIEPASTGETLAAWLDENHDSYDSLVLFAHSLGALVTVEALATLVEGGSDAQVTSVGLLGGAVPQPDVCGAYAAGIEEAVEGGVYNYHSGDDLIVCDLGSPVDGEPGIGCAGTDCEVQPDNYVDVDLTGQVGAHCNYFKPESMEFDDESGVPALVDGQLAPLYGLPRGTVTGTVSVGDSGSGDVGEQSSGTDSPSAGSESTGSRGSGRASARASGDASDADPPAEVELAFVDVATGTLVRTTETGEAGGYEVTLPEATYAVTADEPGLQSFETTVSVAADATAQLDVTLLPLAPIVGDSPPADLNGDGLYRDIDGDGTFDIHDVQALFANLDSPTVQNNPELFDFDGDGDIDVFDVQALFEELQDSDEPALGA